MIGRNGFLRTRSIWCWANSRLSRTPSDLGMKRWHVSGNPCGARVHFDLHVFGVMIFLRIGFASTNSCLDLHRALSGSRAADFVYFYIITDDVTPLDVPVHRNKFFWFNGRKVTERRAIQIDTGAWGKWTTYRISISMIERCMTLNINGMTRQATVPSFTLTVPSRRYFALQVGPHQGYEHMRLIPRHEIDMFARI